MIDNEGVVPGRTGHVVGRTGNHACLNGRGVPNGRIGELNSLDFKIGTGKVIIDNAQLCCALIQYQNQVIAFSIQAHVGGRDADAQHDPIRARPIGYSIIAVTALKAIRVAARPAGEVVVAGTAMQRIISDDTGVADIAKQVVVAAGPFQGIVAFFAVQRVIPSASEQLVIAVAAIQIVVADSAVKLIVAIIAIQLVIAGAT